MRRPGRIRDCIYMRISSLLHEPFEDTGYIRIRAKERGHPFSEIRLYLGEDLPPADDFDLLVVMGGSMNIYEEVKYPWLSEEKKFIRELIDSGGAVLGICLGAQLVASVLGARVTKNKYMEIGWFEVQKTAEARDVEICSRIPERFTAFQWHGDTFDIPEGAVRLFRNEACENQAFLYGDRILGLQFHPEVERETVEAIVENCFDEIEEGFKYIQPLSGIIDLSKIAPANAVMASFMDYFERLLDKDHPV